MVPASDVSIPRSGAPFAEGNGPEDEGIDPRACGKGEPMGRCRYRSAGRRPQSRAAPESRLPGGKPDTGCVHWRHPVEDPSSGSTGLSDPRSVPLSRQLIAWRQGRAMWRAAVYAPRDPGVVRFLLFPDRPCLVWPCCRGVGPPVSSRSLVLPRRHRGNSQGRRSTVRPPEAGAGGRYIVVTQRQAKRG